MTSPILSYCTNVHDVTDFESLQTILAEYPAAIAAETNTPFPVGLWLPQSILSAIQTGDLVGELKDLLDRKRLQFFTLNAFPMARFHQVEVGRSVYKPDWSKPERLQYTRELATLAASLAEPGSLVSISTVPVSYKAFSLTKSELSQAVANLAELAEHLYRLQHEFNVEIVLCLEPEPFGFIETTAETVVFFEDQLRPALRAIERSHSMAVGSLNSFVGVCFDTCHVACEWENLIESVRAYRAAGIRIGKAQLSVALQLNNPAQNDAGWERLLSFHEPCYLHQTLGASGKMRAERISELTSSEQCIKRWRAEDAIRSHFHVPLFWGGDERLGTTRDTLAGVVPELIESGCEHFEVETYSWNVIPEETRKPLGDDLLKMLIMELKYANTLFPNGAGSGIEEL